ncbi:MAG: lysophospholipase [Spirochaetaceae bacterium]|jgi:pimeloyl-ACP methyl ester carboxylesterase|nr:lysophospholipase [Spirochaetaceae bacterium]
MVPHQKLLLVLAAVLTLLAAASMITIHLLFSKVFFGRVKAPESNTSFRQEDYPGDDRGMARFRSGKNTLQGYLYGTGNTKALVVISHGIGSGAADYMAETIWFVNHGYRVFTYDGTGSHASEGRGTTGMAQSKIDLDAALRYIEKTGGLKDLPVLLYGHSWGGYAAAAILAADHPITASVSVAGYNTPGGIVYETAQKLTGPLAPLIYPAIRLNNFFRFGREANAAAVPAINASRTPILIIHGTGDRTIRYDGASIIARRYQITSPGAEFYVRSGEGQNGHGSLFLSAAALAYAEQIQDSPAAERDKFKLAELDEDYMNTVNGFYEKHLGLSNRGGRR